MGDINEFSGWLLKQISRDWGQGRNYLGRSHLSGGRQELIGRNWRSYSICTATTSAKPPQPGATQDDYDLNLPALTAQRPRRIGRCVTGLRLAGSMERFGRYGLEWLTSRSTISTQPCGRVWLEPTNHGPSRSWTSLTFD